MGWRTGLSSYRGRGRQRASKESRHILTVPIRTAVREPGLGGRAGGGLIIARDNPPAKPDMRLFSFSCCYVYWANLGFGARKRVCWRGRESRDVAQVLP